MRETGKVVRTWRTPAGPHRPDGPRSTRVTSPATAVPSAGVEELTKTVVLDTSVLVADPGAIHEFSGCALKVPLTVIEELDGLKSRADAVGQTAREALRRIEALRVSAGGSLVEPLTLSHGGT